MPAPSPPRPAENPFSVLMVCTGNICRSPLAEQLLTSRFGEAGLHSLTTVSSAGLGAVVGAPMDETAAGISTRLRGRPGDFRARQLRSAMVTQADLVLTMTRNQRDELIQRNPRALQKVFTLTEFSKLLALGGGPQPVEGTIGDETHDAGLVVGMDADEVTRAFRQNVQELARMRSRARLLPADDVADPFRRAPEVHEAVGRQISLATSQLALNFVDWIARARRSGRLSA